MYDARGKIPWQHAYHPAIQRQDMLLINCLVALHDGVLAFMMKVGVARVAVDIFAVRYVRAVGYAKVVKLKRSIFCTYHHSYFHMEMYRRHSSESHYAHEY